MTSEPEAKPNGPRLWFSKAKRLRFLVEGVALGSVANFSIPCAAVRSQISRRVRGESLCLQSEDRSGFQLGQPIGARIAAFGIKCYPVTVLRALLWSSPDQRRAGKKYAPPGS